MCGSSTTATTQMTQATQKCGNENERTNCCDVSCCPTAPSDWLLLPQAVRRRVPSEISDNAGKVGSVNLAWSGPLAFRSAALATIAQGLIRARQVLTSHYVPQLVSAHWVKPVRLS